RSLFKKYRKTLWNPFIGAIQRYRLIEEGDRIAVCVSGGKDSMLLAKLIQMLQRVSEVPFEAVYLAMDPGYSPANRRRLEDNAALLGLPLQVFETNVFRVADRAEKSPCYLCAKMRRGHLYSEAKKRGCNKIALGHHFNDVIETTLLGMLYGSQLQGMLPKLHSQNFEGMELIRPLYAVREEDVLAWKRYNGLDFLQCACRFTERRDASGDGIGDSKRQEIKALIHQLKQTNPNVENSLFHSIHAVCLDTFPGYKSGGIEHSFLEDYDGEDEGTAPV
ncbi:MAG: tRNA lysidine(34) synthetase, partial [Acutalibacteraceae bacterium]